MVSGYFFVGGGALKRTKEEAEATRQKIIDACYEIILEKGHEKMTRDDIAARLGMTRGAVNSHFKDKEEMYLVTLNAVLDKLKAQRETYINDSGMTVEQRLHALFQMPLAEADYFHFINHIPHYLLLKESFRCIEQRKQENRIWFMDYMKQCLTEYEQEHDCELQNSKEDMAQLLYLLYEGLHNRNTNPEYETVDFLAKLNTYFEMILR